MQGVVAKQPGESYRKHIDSSFIMCLLLDPARQKWLLWLDSSEGGLEIRWKLVQYQETLVFFQEMLAGHG